MGWYYFNAQTRNCYRVFLAGAEDERRPGESVPVGGGERSGVRSRSAALGAGGGGEEREDIYSLVVMTLSRCMPGLVNIAASDLAAPTVSRAQITV